MFAVPPERWNRGKTILLAGGALYFWKGEHISKSRMEEHCSLCRSNIVIIENPQRDRSDSLWTPGGSLGSLYTEVNLKSYCTNVLLCPAQLSWLDFTALYRPLRHVPLSLLCSYKPKWPETHCPPYIQPYRAMGWPSYSRHLTHSLNLTYLIRE